MTNNRLIRIHITDGGGIFLHGNTENLSMKEFRKLQELEQDLTSPDIMFESIKTNFYFTRKGFNKHKNLIRLLIDGHSPRNEVKLTKIWSKNATILYEDSQQVAIKV